MKKDKLIKQIYEASDSSRRKRGRPNRTWNDEIKMAMKVERWEQAKKTGTRQKTIEGILEKKT